MKNILEVRIRDKEETYIFNLRFVEAVVFLRDENLTYEMIVHFHHVSFSFFGVTDKLKYEVEDFLLPNSDKSHLIVNTG